MSKAIDVYFEKRSRRQYVGRLTKQKRHFVFEYDDAYLYSKYPLAIGPDLLVTQKTHKSLRLFPSFVDRIPSRQNPAYEEYCQVVGISPLEKDPFILLGALGQKGPSSFICTLITDRDGFSAEDLKQFRKQLRLSLREFAELFDVSFAIVHRIENNKSSGRQILKKIKQYKDDPEWTLRQIQKTKVKLHEKSAHFVEKFLKTQINKKPL